MPQNAFAKALVYLLLAGIIGALAMVAYNLFTDKPANRPREVVDAADAPVRPDETHPDAKPVETVPGKPPVPGKPLEGDMAVAAHICREGLLAGAEKPGTLFGHVAQSPASAGSLTSAPSGFNVSNCTTMNADMAAAINAMRAAATAADPAIGRNLVGVSCYRNDAKQRDLFCRADRIAQRGYQGQAFWVAPPGFSEHATGRAIDFGDRSRPDCNVNPCFGDTAVGRWLAANAGRFGFRMSFPLGNGQGVASEAWHFLYVGGSRNWGTPARAAPAPAERERNSGPENLLPPGITVDPQPDGTTVISPTG